MATLELHPLSKPRADKPASVTTGAGALYIAVALVADGRRALGLDGPIEFEHATPTTCKAEQLTRWFGDGLITVQGLAPGPCRLAVRLGSTSSELSLVVKPDP